MALDASVLVDLPEHGIAYKKVSGKNDGGDSGHLPPAGCCGEVL